MTRFALPILFLISISCSKQEFHVYSDPDYIKNVEARFKERKKLAVKRDSELFSVFNQKLNVQEEEGLKFLYAFMPLNDLADYSGDFYLNQVRWSLAARQAFHWGPSVPEDLFRHFVLPYRVNNENLDTARIVFFRELKDRIQHMSMLDAALEVNHWCHEKVTYRGSDIRTSGPLATMRTAYGRCGEESTFTVTALRAVAIPARQVYTPRWAHSDDNHAWVEFWAGGTWYFMGACEPECVPDQGWFTEPARRAMLVHTKAFGQYKGDERVENREENYALLNTLPTYAQTQEIHVQVTNADGTPAIHASVEFTLYNYAEFYPISIKETDGNGCCNFLTGFGDLLIWAHKDSRFGFKKITVADTDTLKLTLDQDPFQSYSIDFDMIPPIQREPLQVVHDCMEQNNLMLRREDSIRSTYERTFRTEDHARKFAGSLNIDPDRVWDFISRSRGNYAEIENFLLSAIPSYPVIALDLLSLVSDKDLRDTKASVLLDHVHNYQTINEISGATIPAITLNENVLNPRVANEILVAYREFLIEKFGKVFVDKVRRDPNILVSWIRQEITVIRDANYYHTPLTPLGTFNLRITDEQSRKIFTVACFRTFGIPSRLKSGTLNVEYWFNSRWTEADFGEPVTTPQTSATLILVSNPTNAVKPQYEIHYTLARFENGKYETLAYGYDNHGDPLAHPLVLPSGDFLLVTGNRNPGGTVLCNLNFFELKGGEEKEIVITLRNSYQNPEVIGKLNPVWPGKLLNGKTFEWDQVISTGKAIICWMEPEKEPSRHVFQDLALLKKEIDKLECPFIFLIPENKIPAGFSSDSWKNLPASSYFVTIKDLSSLSELERSIGKSISGQLPIVIRVDKAGNVTYLSAGYKIGIGEDIVKEINRI